MRSTLVVGAAPAPDAETFYRGLLAQATHVVAADAAAEWCVALDRIPDVAVGDFDSALPGAVQRLAAVGIETVTYPADKDRTDLELAVGLAVERYGPPLVLTAAFTARLDHTLAALGALLRAGAGASALEPQWTALVCQPDVEVRFTARTGTLVSVLAPAGASGVAVEGVRWPLCDSRLEPLSGLGVSNEAVGGEVVVRTGAGALVVLVWNTPR